jgi:hypothetical protein
MINSCLYVVSHVRRLINSIFSFFLNDGFVLGRQISHLKVAEGCRDPVVRGPPVMIEKMEKSQ